MTSRASRADVLIFGIHRTSSWWRFIGDNLGWGSATVVTDLRNEGDISIVDDFYRAYRRIESAGGRDESILSASEQEDVIARCRALRWLPPPRARSMVQAMATVFEALLDRIQPSIAVSFPIDRYVKDVLARLCVRRGIRYVELTASAVPGMSMLLERGRLVEFDEPLPDALIEKARNTLATPAFTPSYVPTRAVYTRTRFIKTLAYFRTRALAFRILSHVVRDPLNLHYIDAQPYLGHKCRWRDIRMVGLCDVHWRRHLERFPSSRRILFGLQLFPEASIDYWIHQRDLIDHENMLVEAARAFSEAGFLVLVKDHPLQFGFRHTDVIDRLLALRNVVLVPYEVPGTALMDLVDTNFTCTGTLGMQAALLGKKSVAVESYYTNESDFILYGSKGDIAQLPRRVEAATVAGDLESRQRRIIGKLLRGSFEGDFFSFKDFRPDQGQEGARALGRKLGAKLHDLIAHGRPTKP